ncbi:hypothetical protein J3R83DRAFT_3664 [Lanmaoa asiatica]|nr:hypothetical protein J3R83DRAFT_3664 [Lanmaoa asiatica]
MFPPPRLASPPPRYDAHSNLRTSSTSLKPYLQLPHILSLAWLAYPIISLLFVIFRLQISSDEAQSSVANAKDDLLTACQAAEQAATAAASMPRYLAIATNQQFADAVNGTMNGAREALVLALTCMEAIINFLISIYRSTFLCFLELVVGGGLDLLISAVQEITSFLQSTLNSIVSGLKSDVTSLNSAIQSAVNSVNSINPFGNIQAPQFNVSKLDALSNITIPTDFETTLIQLNNSLPTVSSIKNTIQDLVDTPFEAVKADINDTFLGLTFDPTLLPVPAQNTVSFCSSLDTSSIDNLGNDLLQITKIGTIILIAVLFLLLAGHCILEWYKWRCLMRHLRFTREAWMSDPTIYHPSGTTPIVTLTDHNLLMLQTDAQHPLLTRIAYTLAAWLRFTPSQHIHLRWFLHYIFHPPALACFLIGFFGLLSVQIQLIAMGPLEAQYATQAAASMQDLSNTIAMQMNTTMYNQSAASTINNGLFGWVNGTTTTLNSTLNNFYADVQNLVGTVFNGTILETPTQDFIKCLVGSKVDAIEQALTFLNQNLNVNLPRANETVLVLSPTDVNEITQPIAYCCYWWWFGQLSRPHWPSCGNNWVDAYRKRKWQKEQRDGLEGFVMPLRVGAPVPHVGDTEKGPTSTFSVGQTSLPHPIILSSHWSLTFEKSWDSFFHEGANNKQSEVSGLRRVASRPMRLMNFGKRKGDEEKMETSEGDRSENKPKSVWFKPVTGLFSKKDSRPQARVALIIPQLTISVEQALTATPRDFPTIDSTPSPVREEPSSAWSVSPVHPTLPWMKVKPIPPKKAIPLTIPPPPPSRPRNANVPTDVGSTPDHGPLAMPLHNAFEERPASQKPVRLALYPTFLASLSDTASSHERHKRSSTVPVLVTPPPAGPISRHESTRSTSRLLTNMHVQSPGEPVDPFATPFDDDASIVSPAKTKRITNPFAGFAL